MAAAGVQIQTREEQTLEVFLKLTGDIQWGEINKSV
jgi:hypothetical protein